MSEGAGKNPGVWVFEPDRVSPTRLARPRARLDDQRVKSTRVVIVASIFLVLIAGGILIGGHAAIDPLLQPADHEYEPNGVGHVVYTMPDGIYCRHVAFDNVTAELTESSIEPCRKDAAPARPRTGRGFAWRTN